MGDPRWQWRGPRENLAGYYSEKAEKVEGNLQTQRQEMKALVIFTPPLPFQPWVVPFIFQLLGFLSLN